MVEGEASRDVHALDVARFGKWITPGFTRAKAKEFYQRRFSVSYPNEELPAARPHQTTPAYSIWKDQRAVFGVGYGMEAVNYFAPVGQPLEETPSFRRSNAFPVVAEECRVVREAVGINEIHNFGKYRVTGAGARDWLDWIMAGRIPKQGRLSLTPMLSPKGKLIGDFTVSCLSETEFQVTASFGMQASHMRWFEQHLPGDGSVRIENVSTALLGFQIAGPKAKELLAAVAFQSVEDIKFLDVRHVDIGTVRTLVQRVSYTGDLGFEIYCPADEQRTLYGLLAEAGEAFGMKPFGMRAMMSLRLEKGFGSWGREFRPDYMPGETGMDRFIAWKKNVDFIGRAAAEKERADGAARKLCTFIVESNPQDMNQGDVWGYEPIFHKGEVVGFVTSGGFAHYSKKSVANGFLPTAMAKEGQQVEIEILGEMRKAVVYTKDLVDPDGSRMRG